MKTASIPLSLKTKALLAVVGIAICVGLVRTGMELARLSDLRRANPFSFAGDQFAPVRNIIQGERIVGYVSDKNFDDSRNIAFFEQVQLTLAPVILDLNNPDHRFLIVDCTDARRALLVLQKYHARAIKASNTGLVIAERILP